MKKYPIGFVILSDDGATADVEIPLWKWDFDTVVFELFENLVIELTSKDSRPLGEIDCPNA